MFFNLLLTLISIFLILLGITFILSIIRNNIGRISRENYSDLLKKKRKDDPKFRKPLDKRVNMGKGHILGYFWGKKTILNRSEESTMTRNKNQWENKDDKINHNDLESNDDFAMLDFADSDPYQEVAVSRFDKDVLQPFAKRMIKTNKIFTIDDNTNIRYILEQEFNNHFQEFLSKLRHQEEINDQKSDTNKKLLIWLDRLPNDLHNYYNFLDDVVVVSKENVSVSSNLKTQHSIKYLNLHGKKEETKEFIYLLYRRERSFGILVKFSLIKTKNMTDVFTDIRTDNSVRERKRDEIFSLSEIRKKNNIKSDNEEMSDDRKNLNDNNYQLLTLHVLGVRPQQEIIGNPKEVNFSDMTYGANMNFRSYDLFPGRKDLEKSKHDLNQKTIEKKRIGKEGQEKLLRRNKSFNDQMFLGNQPIFHQHQSLNHQKLYDRNKNENKLQTEGKEIEHFLGERDLNPRTAEVTLHEFDSGRDGFLCYGPNNPLNQYQRKHICHLNGFKWDRPCRFNEECPFYTANKNYPNDRGKCLKGTCEMPVGVVQRSPRTFEEQQSTPICHNCPGTNKAGPCCDIDSGLVSPDYAFLGDFVERTAAKKQGLAAF